MEIKGFSQTEHILLFITLMTLHGILSFDWFVKFKSNIEVTKQTTLNVFTFLLPCFNARYDFRVKTMLGSSKLYSLFVLHSNLFKYTRVQHDFHIKLCLLTVTWPHPWNKHCLQFRSTSVHPCFCGVRGAQF